MAEWKNPGPPAFKGAGKKDPVVDAWLDDIKAKCTERKIPKDFWHLVGQRSLGSKAKARFNEVDQVMLKMHDGKYKWNWKRFKVAMKNMGCKWNPLFFSASCRYLSFWLTGWRFFFRSQGTWIQRKSKLTKSPPNLPACGGLSAGRSQTANRLPLPPPIPNASNPSVVKPPIRNPFPLHRLVVPPHPPFLPPPSVVDL